MPDDQRIVDLERRVKVLEDRLARLVINTNHVAESQNVLRVAGGTNGSSTQFARADHTH